MLTAGLWLLVCTPWVFFSLFYPILQVKILPFLGECHHQSGLFKHPFSSPTYLVARSPGQAQLPFPSLPFPHYYLSVWDELWHLNLCLHQIGCCSTINNHFGTTACCLSSNGSALVTWNWVTSRESSNDARFKGPTNSFENYLSWQGNGLAAHSLKLALDVRMCRAQVMVRLKCVYIEPSNHNSFQYHTFCFPQPLANKCERENQSEVMPTFSLENQTDHFI